jgi:CHAD domain-containing protein
MDWPSSGTESRLLEPLSTTRWQGRRTARMSRARIMPPPDPPVMLAERGRPRRGRERPDDPGSTVEVPRIKSRDPVARAVLAALETASSRIRGIEPAARRGDAEGIHRLRTTTRRLRSELRAFRDLVDPDWIGPLEREMKWLAGLLGDVRDLDVLTTRFRKAATADDGSETTALAPLFSDLAARHARASRDLRKGLQDERYRDLLAALQHAVDHRSLAPDSRTPCRTALPPLAARAWRRLKKCGGSLRPSDPDEAFHEVRKRAKRARYTVELVAPVLSGAAAKGAHRFIRGATRIQDVLGEHQDAVVAGQELASLIERQADNASFAQAARRLLDGQTAAARAAREEFFDAWDKLDRKKSRRWLKDAARIPSH